MNAKSWQLQGLAWMYTATLLSGCPMMGMSTGASQGKTADLAAPNMAEASGVTKGGVGGDQQQGSLKGGEIDDNLDFDAFLQYLGNYTASNVNRVDVSERYQIRVTDQASATIPNATVSFSLGNEVVYSGRSSSNGRVLFFPKAYGSATGDFLVTVDKGNTQATASLARGTSGITTIPLAMQRGTVPHQVEICFVLDVTGSMGDELAQIRTTLSTITSRIKSLPGDPGVRFSLVAYRDRGSDFVTKSYDFTADLDTFQTRLNNLAAAEGGDYPESVNEAVRVAANDMTWDMGDSLRLMFIVGDAPPHMDYDQDTPYDTSMKKASSKGIKIFPLGASGLDAQGEYVFRQLALFTGGKFLFITYGGATSHDVGIVQENNLDDLVVGIVKTELANLD